MAITEAVAALNADQRHEQEVVRNLRALARADFSSADSRAIRVVSQIKGFLEWLDNPKPEFASASDSDDKFGTLVELARYFPDCNTFFLSEVGVNPSTVWRWANGRSRPSRFVGQKLVRELKLLLADLLLQEAYDVGLMR